MTIVPELYFHHKGIFGTDIPEGLQGLNEKQQARLHVHGHAPRSGEIYQFQYTSGDRHQFDGVVKKTEYLGIENNQPGHLIEVESVREIVISEEPQSELKTP